MAESEVQQADGEDKLPEIDLGNYLTTEGGAARGRMLAELRDAATNWGIVNVVNHGVPSDLVHNVDAKFREFFALPEEHKDRIHRSQPERPWGYSSGGKGDAVGLAWQEAMTVPNDTNILAGLLDPLGLSEFGLALMHYMELMDHMAMALLSLLAEALGLPFSTFSSPCKHSTKALRANYYHLFAHSSTTPALVSHSDTNMLTILYQDQEGGLEVKKGDHWLPVQPKVGSFVINIGDALQVMSNDLLWSVEHRVVLKESPRRRLSMAFFVAPQNETWLVPPHELLNEEHPFKYQSMNWCEFRSILYSQGAMNGKRHLQNCISPQFKNHFNHFAYRLT